MPKTKKKLEDSSSDSDSSGPRDRNPPKKAKSDSSGSPSKSTSSSSKSKSGGGETEWVLDRKRKVTINEFRGKLLVDIREYYEDKDGELKPGKKGISLSTEQYRKFKEVLPEIDEALKNK